MESLNDRRKTLFQKFASKRLEVQQMIFVWIKYTRTHTMETKILEKYKITEANTDKFRKSAGIQMQYYLNEPR